MKRQSKLKIIPVLSLICLCVSSAFVPLVTARDSFAPSWLKEGAYVTYTCKIENSASIFDVDNPRYEGLNYMNASLPFDGLRYSSATLTWRCITINTTTAKLQVTFDYFGKTLEHNTGAEPTTTSLDGESLQRTGEVYVDLYTRAVYNADGVLLGTTHLWLPANPSDGQEIVVWDVEPKTITLPVSISSGTETIQGPQDTFTFDSTSFQLADTNSNSAKSIGLIYDLDTGLAVDGYFQWDPIMASVGIADSGLIGDGLPNTVVSDTNINLGLERATINWTQILQYSILPIAVVLLVGAFVVRQKRKKLK